MGHENGNSYTIKLTPSILFETIYDLLVQEVDAPVWKIGKLGREYQTFLSHLDGAKPFLDSKYGTNWLVILLIDEMDGALRKLQDDQFFQNLRNLLMVSRYNRHFRIIAAGVKDMSKLIFSGSSPLKKEFLGHREAWIQEGVDLLIRGVKTLTNQTITSQPKFSDILSEIKTRKDEIYHQYVQHVHREFLEWGKQFHAQFHPIAPHHGETVLNAYFDAARPFKPPQIVKKDFERSKREFPDAFLWQTVLDLHKAYGVVHFISKNTHDFQKVCETIPEIIFHQSIKDFLSLQEIQPFLMRQFLDQHFDEIIGTLRQQEVTILPKIREAVAEKFSWQNRTLLEDLLNDPEVELTGFSYPNEAKWRIEVQYDAARHSGYGIISLPIIIDMERVGSIILKRFMRFLKLFLPIRNSIIRMNQICFQR